MVKRRQNELVSTRKKTPARARKSMSYLCIKLSLLDVKPCLYTIVGWVRLCTFQFKTVGILNDGTVSWVVTFWLWTHVKTYYYMKTSFWANRQKQQYTLEFIFVYMYLNYVLCVFIFTRLQKHLRLMYWWCLSVSLFVRWYSQTLWN